MQRLGWLSLAAVLGAVLRYLLGGWAQRYWGSSFPWGTWLINGSGCFLFGFIWATAEERMLLNPDLRIVILTGFVGSYTTFSTYLFEVGQQIQDGQWLYALGNFFGQNLLGIALLFLGMALARIL